MIKRYERFNVFIFMFIVLTLGHTSFHMLFLGTGVQGFLEHGISGLAITEKNNDSSNLSFMNIISTVMVFGEWLTLAVFIIFLYTNYKIKEQREFIDLKTKMKNKKIKSLTETELDHLYEMLQQKKRIRLNVISKLFKVDKEKVMEWGRILESGKLAELEYPAIGGPSLAIIEN